MGEGQLWPQLILTLKKRLFSIVVLLQFSFYEKKIENTLVARGGVLITKAARATTTAAAKQRKLLSSSLY